MSSSRISAKVRIASRALFSSLPNFIQPGSSVQRAKTNASSSRFLNEAADIEQIAMAIIGPDGLNAHAAGEALDRLADQMRIVVARAVEQNQPIGVWRLGRLAGEGQMHGRVGRQHAVVTDFDPF